MKNFVVGIGQNCQIEASAFVFSEIISERKEPMYRVLGAWHQKTLSTKVICDRLLDECGKHISGDDYRRMSLCLKNPQLEQDVKAEIKKTSNLLESESSQKTYYTPQIEIVGDYELLKRMGANNRVKIEGKLQSLQLALSSFSSEKPLDPLVEALLVSVCWHEKQARRASGWSTDGTASWGR